MTEPALLRGERVVHRARVSLAWPSRPLSAIGVLRSLAGTQGREPLGSVGPVRAGETVPRGADDTPADEHLRLFEAVFGRDSLICARILLPWYRGLAVRTVIELARYQGRHHVVHSEEEPGRIPHEIRDPSDPVARRITRDAGWRWPYYGSIDATCLWLVVVDELARSESRVLDLAVARPDGTSPSIRACAESAADWVVRRLDGSPSGFLESTPAFAGAIENQVWKDSWDAYSHQDGSLATQGTIASVEVQGLVCDALGAAARLGVRNAPELERRAAELARRVRDEFWVSDAGGGFFALGLDRDAAGRSRPIAVRSSNMGHLLSSVVLDGEESDVRRLRAAVAEAVTAPDMVCAAGIRTLSSRERRYRPTGYHNGSSWPWDGFVVAEGLRRHGFTARAAEIRSRILHGHLATGLFPEFFCGTETGETLVADQVVDVVDAAGRRNRVSQPPQEVQAWTAAAVLATKWIDAPTRGRGRERRS